MSTDLTVWFNPQCSKCRTAHGILEERGVAADYVRYLDDAPSREDLERLLVLLGTDDPRAITRAGEPVYSELGLEGVDRDTLLDALAAHPILIERPIAIRGDRAVVARPPERILELLDGS
jgi:arsenate reductase